MGSLNAGHIVAGRYRLVSPLGRGAMGEVWKAIHTGLGTPVAIKVIVDADFGAQNPKRDELVTRFFREAQAAASLRSPHVVQIFDHGDDGVPYIAMELLEGETLEQRLERARVLSPKETAEIITQISRAVGKAHEAGIIHRDLKPGNVFLVKNDDQEIAKVLDFGIAKVSAPADGQPREGVMTRTGSVVGTPCYMSPEQALGNKSIDFHADLWSMAIMAFECLVGRRPFDGDALGVLIVQICAKPIPIPSKMASVPVGFDGWFAKAASRDPAGRFPSAKTMADALRDLLLADNLRMTPPPPGGFAAAATSAGGSGVSTAYQRTHMAVVSAIVNPGKRRPARGTLFAGALLLSALVIAGLFVALRGSASPTPIAKPASTSDHTAPTAAPTTSSPEALPATAVVTPSAVTAAPTTEPAPTQVPSAKPSSVHSTTNKPPTTRPPVSKPDRLGF